MSRRDLAGMDADMFTPIGRLLQQAMAHGITNDMIFGGLETGQTSLQAIHAISATQNCRIGTRRITWDGRVYKYGKAESTLNTAYLCASSNRTQEVGYVAVSTGAAAGEDTIIITVGASDGDGSGNIAVNALKDGILCVDMGQTGAVYQMHIKSNTVLTGDGGGEMTVVVDEPFPLAVTDSMYVEAMMNTNSGLINSGVSSRASYLGLPQRDATSALPFNWILTHGPCWVTPNNSLAAHNLGNADYSNQVVAHPSEFGGSVGPHDDAYALTVYQQHVGFVISWAQAGTQGAPFIMLKISS